MKILFVGKFPPIEGGVSADTYWLVRAMALQGHEVDVLTNASEVDATFRQFLYGTDSLQLETLDGFRVYSTTPVPYGSYIPFAQPFVTKLIGKGLDLARQVSYDAIITWYFEPYAIAAAVVSAASGVPLFVRHAGSDLGRLSMHPDLRSSYEWIIQSATGLMISNEAEFESHFGKVRVDRIPLVRPQLPDAFTGPVSPLDITEIRELAQEWFHHSGLSRTLIGDLSDANVGQLGVRKFVIGSYGKVGTTKGSFDLLAALSNLAEGGLDFTFITVSCGHADTLRAYYESILSSKRLAERTVCLPPIAPWRVPRFLALCDLVCFLERDFPISFHGPGIPREVLSSKRCLLCSGEIASKQPYRDRLVHMRNALIVQDPKDHSGLADVIAGAAHDPQRTASIGYQGRRLLDFLNQEMPEVSEVAASISAHVARLSAARRASSPVGIM